MSQQYTITYAGKEYKLTVERQENNVLIYHEDTHYSVTVHETQKLLDTRPTSTPSSTVASPPPSSSQRTEINKPASDSDTASNGAVAPITGVVKNIHVAIGDAIEQDQLIVTMEAMKMDIPVKAVSAGVVQEIKVAVGDSVQQNALLILVG